jgi:hypothetical protein
MREASWTEWRQGVCFKVNEAENAKNKEEVGGENGEITHSFPFLPLPPHPHQEVM